MAGYVHTVELDLRAVHSFFACSVQLPVLVLCFAALLYRMTGLLASAFTRSAFPSLAVRGSFVVCVCCSFVRLFETHRAAISSCAA